MLTRDAIAKRLIVRKNIVSATMPVCNALMHATVVTAVTRINNQYWTAQNPWNPKANEPYLAFYISII